MDQSTSLPDTKQQSPPSNQSPEEAPKSPHNLNAITVYATSNLFLLDPSQACPMETRLLIDRRTGSISELEFSAGFNQQIEFKKSYSAFLGIVNILDRAFLLLVDEVHQVCTLGRHRIYAVFSVSFIPVEVGGGDYFNSERGAELLNLISTIRTVLTQGFYFSYTYDLTLSKTRKTTASGSDPKFMWNRHMQKELVNYNIDPRWQLPLIQGYITHFSMPLNKKPLKYYIISRRSCLRAGPRANSRGLDDDGNVSNFVETEQIVYYNGYCCSHSQLRGNPPVFFTGAQAKVTRNVDLTTNAFLKHMQTLEADWGYILCINLLTTSKKEEQSITDVYESLMRNYPLPKTRYEFLDYLNATKGQKHEKVNIFVQKLKPLLEHMNFYAEDEITGSVKLTQKGTLKTSCIDGLDRTNALQTKIAIAVFDLQMRQVGVDLTTEFTQDPVYQIDNDNMKHQHPLLMAFKDVWAENGDCLSMLYSNVLSTLTQNTKNSKFFGFLDNGMKIINAFNLTPIEDQIKQEGISLLVGQHLRTINALEKAVEDDLKTHEKEYAKYEEVSVFIITWNVGNFVPSSNFDFVPFFDFEGKPAPDVVAVGLQEHIELNAANVVVGNNESIDFVWQELLLKALKKSGGYIVVHKEVLVGILLIIFVKEHLRDRINNLDVDIVKTGLAGTLGNKGAVVMKFNIDDSSLCFLNCHMEAGNKQNNARLVNLSDFHQKAFQQGGFHKKPEDKIMNCNYKFLFGDTNFRLNSSYPDVKDKLAEYKASSAGKKEEILQYLLDEDQLLQSRGSSDILDKYMEGKITFLPTYKYDVGSEEYDTSRKMRTPSWTDRILYRCDSGEIKQHFYSRREYVMSDHRPVVAYFTIRVRTVNKPAKQDLIKKLSLSLSKSQTTQSSQNIYNQNIQNIQSMIQSQNIEQLDTTTDEKSLLSAETNS